MQFSPTEPFTAWRGDRLLAAYQPGLGYTVREGNDLLRALVMGGPLPGNETITIEKAGLNTQSQIQPGEECPGWLKTGLVILTGLAATGFSGADEVKQEIGRASGRESGCKNV